MSPSTVHSSTYVTSHLMKIKIFEFNMFPVNCYVLSDETKEAVIIDAGCFYDEEKQALPYPADHA